MGTNPLGEEKIGALLRKFAIPSIVAMLVSSLYNIVLLFAPPMPKSSAMAMQEMDRGKLMFVAAFPSSPMLCPIKNWSTIL